MVNKIRNKKKAAPPKKWARWGAGTMSRELTAPEKTTRFRLAQKGTRFSAPLYDSNGEMCIFDDKHPVHDIPDEVAEVFHQDARTAMRLVVVKSKGDERIPKQPAGDMGSKSGDGGAGAQGGGPPTGDHGSYRQDLLDLSRVELDKMVEARDGDPSELKNKEECVTFILSTPDPDAPEGGEEDGDDEDDEDGDAFDPNNT